MQRNYLCEIIRQYFSCYIQRKKKKRKKILLSIMKLRVSFTVVAKICNLFSSSTEIASPRARMSCRDCFACVECKARSEAGRKLVTVIAINTLSVSVACCRAIFPTMKRGAPFLSLSIRKMNLLWEIFSRRPFRRDSSRLDSDTVF